MKRKALKSGTIGFLLGCFTCLLFSVAVSLRMGTGDFYFVLPALAEHYPNELSAALIQMAVFCWFGTACGIAYLFSVYPGFSPAKQGTGYLASLTLGMIPLACAGQWKDHIFVGVFSYIAIVAAVSLVFFLVGMIKLKSDVDEIRQAMGIKKETQKQGGSR